MDLPCSTSSLGTSHPPLPAQATKKLPQGQSCGSSRWLATTTPTRFAFDLAGVISRFQRFLGDSIPFCHLQPTIAIRNRLFYTSPAPVFQGGARLAGHPADRTDPRHLSTLKSADAKAKRTPMLPMASNFPLRFPGGWGWDQSVSQCCLTGTQAASGGWPWSRTNTLRPLCDQSKSYRGIDIVDLRAHPEFHVDDSGAAAHRAFMWCHALDERPGQPRDRSARWTARFQVRVLPLRR